MKKLMLVVFPLIAFLGGAFSGEMFAGSNSPDGKEEAHTADTLNDDGHGSADSGHGGGNGHGGEEADTDGLTWMEFPTQFFIPVMRHGDVKDVMILSLTLELPVAAEREVYQKEHRLRDALLRRLLIHANTGGFDGNFTTEVRLDGLRRDLLEAVAVVAGDNVETVLIGDIARHSSSK